MSKGFEVKCLKCGEVTNLTSQSDNHMGFSGSDIKSSNRKIYVTPEQRKTVTIGCECGNSITEF